MKKMYTIGYFICNMPCSARIGNKKELVVLLTGDASGCMVEVKISENMPVSMHMIIAKHNLNVEKSTYINNIITTSETVK